ncbi:MAG: molybdenum cofactor biosynthesis protein MoaE [Planctomycetota bacterium]|nr:molybdopterin converting factor [Planctomycetota bacterium]MEE3053565.1 molybdenum cofactor biosynthesis protein MoaE [Planctomycetota bacterium]
MDRIVSEAIDCRAIIDEVTGEDRGAVLTFAGTVRNTNLGRTVRSIDYHAYESMARKELEKLELETAGRWPGVKIRIVHRIGRLDLGEASVFIAAAGAHRDESFAALRHAIDRLKENAPVWKRELYEDGSEAWLEGS